MRRRELGGRERLGCERGEVMERVGWKREREWGVREGEWGGGGRVGCERESVGR